MVSVAIFFFRSRCVFARKSRKYISKETRFVSRFEVWNFRLKKRITRGRIRFFFLFCSSRELERSFRKHTEIAKPNSSEAKPRGPLCGEKGERARANLQSERQTNRRRRCVVIAREGGHAWRNTYTRNKQVHAYTYSAHGK